jgi:hypothetical protein
VKIAENQNIFTLRKVPQEFANLMHLCISLLHCHGVHDLIKHLRHADLPSVIAVSQSD